MRDATKARGKYIGTFTARGKMTENETEQDGPQRIHLFDGRFDTGFVVKEFFIWASDWDAASASDGLGKLATSPNVTDTPASFMNADDSRELAWAFFQGSTDTGLDAFVPIIDPDNLIVEDLWVFIRGAGDTRPFNYMVVMDKFELTDAVGTVAMARDRARDSSSEWRTP